MWNVRVRVEKLYLAYNISSHLRWVLVADNVYENVKRAEWKSRYPSSPYTIVTQIIAVRL